MGANISVNLDIMPSEEGTGAVAAVRGAIQNIATEDVDSSKDQNSEMGNVSDPEFLGEIIISKGGNKN